ncbi:protein NLRC5-like [Astyanax mexicanus]|uniref:protein NLRC5-like n=1 Tax=Astyanax mexicanus TaxID=7994 RepID=UPI0020CB0ABA|nr:protein NLRC5-like [Astyanax mexicanus]
MRSEQSMDPPNKFKETSVPQKRENSGLSEQPEHPHFHAGEGDTSTRDCSDTNGSETAVRGNKLQKKINDLFRIFDDLEKKIIVLVKHELEMYKKLLRKENSKFYGETKEDMWNLKDGVLNITLLFLTMMKHEDLAEALQDALIEVQQRALKSRLIQKYQRVYEGIAKQGEFNILKKIYTDLYITEGGTGRGNKEHEVRRIEKNQMQQEVPIKCENMFEPLPEQDKPIQTVLTQGVAGIGKSICVQKFILDWAEGKKYQDIHLIFPLPFRELNLKKGTHSLMEIIYFFFPETKGLRLTDQHKVMFIFDGLDECKLPLAFQENEIWNNVSLPAPLDVVMTNLIKGNLLPSALIWITSRPAAASKIPPDCINRVTEVRGFNDDQKEEYFRKRIKDKKLAQDIIDHIKQSRSLFIMCHIPVFCWISATVLQNFFEEQEGKDTPKTLTEMYTSFLIFHIIQNNIKYTGQNVDDTPWDKEGILSLGKLAFQHLEENDLIFYENSLKECGIDPRKKSVYSGLYTQEHVRFLGTIFSFVHLSIQEFLAALFAYLCATNDKKNVFDHQPSLQENKEAGVIVLLKIAVDKALESEHGHMDLFLRFLLGLSMESNRKLLRGLLTQTGNVPDCRKEIVEYIKFKLDKDRQNMSAERSINLFYCLHELNDDSLVKEIQRYMSSGSLSEAELSPVQWSALVFVLLTSKNKLEVFDLQKFIKSDECLNRLLSVIQDATSALLNECNLTERSCSALCRVLSSETSRLTRLDLSNNELCDSGIEQLSKGLSSSTCKLKELRLSFCSITEEGYDALASALNSNFSHLIELDLIGNDPGDKGVKLITDVQKCQNCKLKTIRLLKSSDAEEACDFLGKVLGVNPLLLKELDLSGKIQGDQAVKQLSALLEDQHCRPETIKLSSSNISEEGCAALSSALCYNPSHLKDLDLSGNELGNSGVQQICILLKSQNCKLKVLKLSSCSIKEDGYAELALTLESNPSSHLTDLDLSQNDPGDKGVELMYSLLQNPNFKLKKLRLLKSSAAEETCDFLEKVLGVNPLLLKELDLSGKIQGDSAVKQLSALLEDPHCRPETIKLNSSSITEDGCAALSAALCLNPSHLKELDLHENKLKSSGVQMLCTVLQKPDCKLQKLILSSCSVEEEGYTALASSLKSNPSVPLIELDLRGNDPGDTGVKPLIDLLVDPNYKLNILRLGKCSITEDGCAALASALGTNLCQLTELDLRKNKFGDAGLMHLSDLLMSSNCKLENLNVSDNNITEKGYVALASVLKSSNLKWLDLSGNNPGDKGIELVSALLQDPQCKVRLLKDNAEEACDFLTKVLGINPLLLRELDLSGKIQGDTAVKQICALLEDPHCQITTLGLKNVSITEKGCVDLASVLCKNPLHLRELNLSGNKLGGSGINYLCQVLGDTRFKLLKLQLNNSNIAQKGCAALSLALSSNPSLLKDLDLSGNNFGHNGVQSLCGMLINSNCTLEKLNISACDITEEGYDALASALKSNSSSYLTELDLRENFPGDKGVKLINDLLNHPNCKIKTLRVLKNAAAEKACDFLTEVLGKNPLLLRELDLSGKIQGDQAVKQISALLEDPHCILKQLKLNNCSITEDGCAALSSALRLNPLHLKELDLSENKLENSGVKRLTCLLQNSKCKLELLNLSDCCITEEGYVALKSALKSSCSPCLKELILKGNDPGDTGVELLTDVQKDPTSKLKILRLLKTPAAEEAWNSLSKDLETNLLLQKKLELKRGTEGKSGDLRVKQLCHFLKDTHCKLKKLQINNDELTEESCAALSTVLPFTSLTELDLSNNNLQDSGVKNLCKGLSNPLCKLEILRLSCCSVTEEGYALLASTLQSNQSSHLKELDLRGNNPGKDIGSWKGVENIITLFDRLEYKQKTLRLLKDELAQQACDFLTKQLQKNPLLMKNLDLSINKEFIEMRQLTALLQDPHCRLEKLTLYKSDKITENNCNDLVAALTVNPSHLRELDMKGNTLGEKALFKLCHLLTTPLCCLEKLNLSHCCITEEGYLALARALKSNPSSQLLELDLTGNTPGEKGVKQLIDVLKDRTFKLNTLRFLSPAADEACTGLTRFLGTNPLIQTELNLSGKRHNDSFISQLSALINDSHCILRKLK